MWPTLIPMLGNLMDRLFPDPKAAADAKLEVMRLAQSGELAQLNADVQLATGQIEVNKVEAASTSLFVAGWRPAVGWICAAAFAFKFIGGPAAFGETDMVAALRRVVLVACLVLRSLGFRMRFRGVSLLRAAAQRIGHLV